MAAKDDLVSFSYDSLPSADSWIRILRILPDSTSDLIRCSMTSVELNPATEDTCLSYTWGAPALSKAITVNSQRLPVRENLHAFLRECTIRKQCINTSLWIDAVCINQDDIAEKNKQVAMMGEIYSHAKQVIIWLGSGDTLVEAAIDHVKRYMDEVPYDPEAADAELEKIDGTSINTKPVDDLGRPVREYWDNYDVIGEFYFNLGFTSIPCIVVRVNK